MKVGAYDRCKGAGSEVEGCEGLVLAQRLGHRLDALVFDGIIFQTQSQEALVVHEGLGQLFCAHVCNLYGGV